MGQTKSDSLNIFHRPTTVCCLNVYIAKPESLAAKGPKFDPDVQQNLITYLYKITVRQKEIFWVQWLGWCCNFFLRVWSFWFRTDVPQTSRGSRQKRETAHWRIGWTVRRIQAKGVAQHNFLINVWVSKRVIIFRFRTCHVPRYLSNQEKSCDR